MAAPNTTGRLVTTLAGMNVGDYIACVYTANTSGSMGKFSGLGNVGAVTELPQTNSVAPSATPNGFFYFIKVDTGLLIADRVIQGSITWDTVNNAFYVQGCLLSTAFSDTSYGSYGGIIRSPKGGVAYADANGNYSASSINASYGAFPQNNEWDTYIRGSTLNGTITAGDNNVWNWSKSNTWCQETIVVGIAASTGRTIRSSSTSASAISYGLATSSGGVGFRPVLQYK